MLSKLCITFAILFAASTFLPADATFSAQVPSARYLNMTNMGSFIAYTHSFVISSGKNFTDSYIAHDIGNKVFVTYSDDAITMFRNNVTYVTYPPSAGGGCYVIPYTYDQFIAHMNLHFKDFGVHINFDYGLPQLVHRYMGQGGEAEVCTSGHYGLALHINEDTFGADRLTTWEYSAYISLPLTYPTYAVANTCAEADVWGRYDGKIKHIVTDIDPITSNPSVFNTPAECLSAPQTYEEYCCKYYHETVFDLPDAAY
jgi:hypothetical protein